MCLPQPTGDFRVPATQFSVDRANTRHGLFSLLNLPPRPGLLAPMSHPRHL